MKYKQIFLLFFSTAFNTPAFSQDTSCYCQANSPWVSNCYHFYKSNKSKEGTFEKIMSSDDGQRWYGSGEFTETKRKITIHSFKVVRTVYNVTNDGLVKDTSVSDTSSVRTLTYHKKGDKLYFRKGMTKKTWFNRCPKKH